MSRCILACEPPAKSGPARRFRRFRDGYLTADLLPSTAVNTVLPTIRKKAPMPDNEPHELELTSGFGPGAVVVGVDGSPNSVTAIRFAVEEAAFRETPLRALISWELPMFYGAEMSMVTVDPNLLEEGAVAILDGALKEAVPDEYRRSAIQRSIVFGPPAQALIKESLTAEVVVCGARGHGGFVGLLLGSVCNQVVHRSHCPVIVVPHPDHRPIGTN